jgi:hypothetical protein
MDATPMHVAGTVCSPVRQCFPPGKTTCLICKMTDRSACPLKPEGNSSEAQPTPTTVA